MKQSLFLLIILLTGISSCKKNDLPAKRTFDIHLPKVKVDFRDTIAGDYTGSMHYVHTAVWGSYIVQDTTYPYILHVLKDSSSTSNSNSFWMDGIEVDANSSFAIHLNQYWSWAHPRQSASGQFTFSSSYTSLNYMHSDGYGSDAYTYTFQGNK